MECEPPSPRSQNRFTDFCDNEEPAIGPSPPRRVVLGEIAPNGVPMEGGGERMSPLSPEGGMVLPAPKEHTTKKLTKRPALWIPKVSFYKELG